MKKYLIILAFAIASINLFAQQNPMNEAMVYFQSGVIRNPDTTATITSQNILNVLNNLNIPTSNVIPAFPEFNESDTTISFPEFPNEPVTKEMNRIKVYRIICVDTFQRNQLISNLLTLVEVLFAEPNGTAEHDFIPSDTRFNEQWGLRNTTFPGRDIHAEQAWDIFRGTANNIIAIIDWGSNSGHPDLQGKVVGGDAGFNANNHGMHVAGIAAAISDNNLGVSGVDHFARIHPRRMDLTRDDRGTTRIITDAVRFSPDVRVVNNSWGLITGRDEFGNGIPGRYSTVVRSAFATVYKQNRVSCVAMGNHNDVFGAGNRYANIIAFPAGFNSGLIAVGATDIADDIANFSARGQHIDVSAPGVNILSTVGTNDYAPMSGTSMATPHVSGLASLLRGFNPNLANDDIEQIIRITANDVNGGGFDNNFGTGRINAEAALQSLQAPNQLFQWSTTGSQVVSTTNQERRIFLGFPGLADAAYLVRRSEVRTNVIFPTGMCQIIGAWGRGVGTTGYREERGTCYGEGICEIVPGTLTNTGATLRTWIYEVWSINGQYIGFYPRAANNVVFQYTVLGVPRPTTINGDNSFCTTSNNYTIPNLPIGATVQWQATPFGIVTINSPNSPQTTLTINSNGVITLTAIISNVCGEQITLTRENILVGAPLPPTIVGLNYDRWCGTYVEAGCTHPAGATNYIWNLNYGQVTGEGDYFYQSPLVYNPMVGFTYYNYLSVQAQNACGTSDPTTVSLTVGPVPARCGGGMQLMLSPNPTSSTLTVEATNDHKFTKLRIVDKMGQVRKQFSYPPSKQAIIDVSNLPPDVYRVLAWINNNWVAGSFIKQ